MDVTTRNSAASLVKNAPTNLTVPHPTSSVPAPFLCKLPLVSLFSWQKAAICSSKFCLFSVQVTSRLLASLDGISGRPKFPDEQI